MLQAVIFDMDGVLIDSELIYLKRNLVFARKKNPDIVLSDIFGMVGASRRDAWVCMEKAIHNGQSWAELRAEYYGTNHIFEETDYRAIFRKEIPEILRGLQNKGLKLAVASSTQMDVVQKVLHVNEIDRFFELVVSGAQFTQSKPDPEIYYYTAAHLGVPEKNCLVIEDSTLGITAGHRAGMHVAALIDDRFGFDRSLADWEMKSLTEIPGIADSLMQESSCAR